MLSLYIHGLIYIILKCLFIKQITLFLQKKRKLIKITYYFCVFILIIFCKNYTIIINQILYKFLIHLRFYVRKKYLNSCVCCTQQKLSAILGDLITDKYWTYYNIFLIFAQISKHNCLRLIINSVWNRYASIKYLLISSYKTNTQKKTKGYKWFVFTATRPVLPRLDAGLVSISIGLELPSLRLES